MLSRGCSNCPRACVHGAFLSKRRLYREREYVPTTRGAATSYVRPSIEGSFMGAWRNRVSELKHLVGQY